MESVIVRPLSDLEATIERGLATFVEVGQALLEIREHRLYRETHDSFETYCRERWGFNRQRASQLIQAAELSTIVDIPPSNEAQARELTRLKGEPDAVREVWSEVRDSKGSAVTAADVREAVDRRLGIPKPASSHHRPSPIPEGDISEETGGLCFECRQPIPANAEACPSCAEEAKADLSARQTVIAASELLETQADYLANPAENLAAPITDTIRELLSDPEPSRPEPIDMEPATLARLRAQAEQEESEREEQAARARTTSSIVESVHMLSLILSARTPSQIFDEWAPDTTRSLKEPVFLKLIWNVDGLRTLARKIDAFADEMAMRGEN